MRYSANRGAGCGPDADRLSAELVRRMATERVSMFQGLPGVQGHAGLGALQVGFWLLECPSLGTENFRCAS